MDFHIACEYSSTINLNATYSNGSLGIGATLTSNTNGPLILDGITADLVGDRVLIPSQTDAKQNGIYVVTDLGSPTTPFVLTRASDYDNSSAHVVSYGDITLVI